MGEVDRAAESLLHIAGASVAGRVGQRNPGHQFGRPELERALPFAGIQIGQGNLTRALRPPQVHPRVERK